MNRKKRKGLAKTVIKHLDGKIKEKNEQQNGASETASHSSGTGEPSIHQEPTIDTENAVPEN